MRNPSKKEMEALNELLATEEEASAVLDLAVKRLRREYKVGPKCEICADGRWRDTVQKDVNDRPLLVGDALTAKHQELIEDLNEKAQFIVAERRVAMAELRRKCEMPFNAKIDPYRGVWIDAATQQPMIDDKSCKLQPANGNGSGKKRRRRKAKKAQSESVPLQPPIPPSSEPRSEENGSEGEFASPPPPPVAAS